MTALLVTIAVIVAFCVAVFIGMVLFEFGSRVMGRIEAWFDKYFP